MTIDTKVRSTSQILWGTVLLLIGSALLLDNLGAIRLGSVWEHWPLIIVAVGIGKLIAARTTNDRGEGLFWVFIGGWLYISVFEYFDLGFRESWPLLLIGWGISMVWKSLTGDSLHIRVSGTQVYTGEPRPSKGDSE